MSKLLSEREKDILTDIAKGYEDKQIARHYNLSTRTVSTHLSKIYAKMGVNNRAHAVAVFMKTYLFPELSDVF